MTLKILDYSISLPEFPISIDESIIVVGDTLKLIDYLPFGFAHLIFIDPPYGEVVDADWDKWIITDSVAKQIVDRITSNGSMYICCGQRPMAKARWLVPDLDLNPLVETLG